MRVRVPAMELELLGGHLEILPRVRPNGAHVQFRLALMLYTRVRFRIVQFSSGILPAIVLATMPASAVAQGATGFRSPSGNIHCQYFGGKDATVRCDLRQISNRPPPRPADCDLEWGKAFEISANAARGT